MKNKLNIAFTLGVILSMMINSVAMADNLITEGDGLILVNNKPIVNLGDVCQSQSKAGTILLAISRQGSSTGNNAFANDAEISLTAGNPSSLDMSTSFSDDSINLPLNWTTQSNGSISNDRGVVSIIVNTIDSDLGAKSGSVEFSATGNNTGGDTISRSVAVTATWTVVSCDSTPPVITPVVVGTLGNDSWYTSNIGLSWNVSDPDSAISSSTGCNTTTISADTTGASLTCQATSKGGTSSVSVTLKRDTTLPGIVWSGEINDDDSFVYGALPPVPTCSATDATSGPDGCVITGYGTSTGDHILTATAKDKAGNTTVETRAYSVSKADATCEISGYSGKYDAASHGASGSCLGVDGESAGTIDFGATYKDFPGGKAHWVFTGNENYKDQSGNVDISISKADAVCTISGYSGKYDAAFHGASGFCIGIDGETAGVLDLGATFKDVPGGKASWTFTGNGNYNDQSGDVSVVISKANATCNIDGYTGIYDGNFHGATGSCAGVAGETAGDLDLGASYTDFPGGTAHWTFTGNANYEDQNGDVAIEIGKANANCGIDGYTGTYDGNFHGATGSCSGIDGKNAGTLNLGESFKNVPGGTAHWIFTGNVNYEDQNGDVAIKIGKADATCSVNLYKVTYDGATHTATGSCMGVENEILGGLDLSGTTHTDADVYLDSWSFSDSTGNYNDTFGTVSDIIEKAYATIDVSGYSGVYDGDAHGATGKAEGVNHEDLSTLLHLGGGFTNVPGGTANWTFEGNNNYKSAGGSVAIIITQAEATIDVSGYSGVYDATAHGATGTASGVKQEILNSLLHLGDRFTNVPGGPANWTFDGNTNYKPASGSVPITITPADASCTINGYIGVYDAANHGASGSCAGVVGETAETIGTLDLGATFTDVPGGKASWTFTGNGNYKDQSGDVTIDISKADATCTVNNYTGIYDGNFHGATGSCAGVTGETAETIGTLDLGATFTNVPGGKASWTFAGNGNYEDQSGTADVVINQADATIEVSGSKGVYDGNVHFATGTATGVKDEDLNSLLHLGNGFTNVPGGTVNWTFEGNTNYKSTTGSVDIEITKAPLTVMADNQSIIFGQPLPAFTFQYSGFVNGEDESVLATAPTCGVGSIPMYGTYPITCSGGVANNYSFTYVPGTLNVQAWDLKGFYQPVDMKGVYNIVKNGSTVPLKFEVFTGATELTDVSRIKPLVTKQVACATNAVTDAIETLAAGNTVLRYDATAGQFIYNWKTSGVAGNCYSVTMTTQDGSSLAAYFKLK